MACSLGGKERSIDCTAPAFAAESNVTIAELTTHFLHYPTFLGLSLPCVVGQGLLYIPETSGDTWVTA